MNALFLVATWFTIYDDSFPTNWYDSLPLGRNRWFGHSGKKKKKELVFAQWNNYLLVKKIKNELMKLKGGVIWFIIWWHNFLLHTETFCLNIHCLLLCFGILLGSIITHTSTSFSYKLLMEMFRIHDLIGRKTNDDIKIDKKAKNTKLDKKKTLEQIGIYRRVRWLKFWKILKW